MKIYNVLVFILLLLAVGCREKVDYDFPDFDSITTLNSILVADSLFELHLGLTGGFSNDSLPVIENLQPKVYINDTVYNLKYKKSGVYVADFNVIPGNNYTCEVETDDNIVLNASCSVPQPEPIIESKFLPNVWVDSDGYSWPAVEFTIANHKETIKYFEIVVLNFVTHIPEGEEMGDYFGKYTSCGVISLGVFNTEDEDDELIKKHIEVKSNIISYSPDSKTIYGFIVELRTVNKDYYDYYESLQLYEQGRFPEFDLATPTPHNLYSNINNGIGIFAGYSCVQTDTLF